MKILKGTDQKCRMAKTKNEPVISSISEIKAGNKSILKSKRSRKIFLEKANQLIALRILSVLDLEQLVIYAWSLDKAFTAIEEIRKDDAIAEFSAVYNKEGDITKYVENPYYKRFRDMVDVVNKIGTDFGFSPVSRIRMKDIVMNKENDGQPFSDL